MYVCGGYASVSVVAYGNPKRVSDSLGLQEVVGCLVGCWKLNLGVLQEHAVFYTLKPSFYPLTLLSIVMPFPDIYQD